MVAFSLMLFLMAISLCLTFSFFSKEKCEDASPLLVLRQKQERALKAIMIRDEGAYTLLGSKPVVLISLFGKCMQEWNLRSYYDELPETLKEKFPFDEVFNNLSTWQLWKVWLNKWEENPSNDGRYLFFRRGEFAYFVNTRELITTLSHYYHDFAKAYGKDFDPLKVTFEMPDEKSQFWKIVDENHYLLGLILGYGGKNAYLFSLVQKEIFPDLSIKWDLKEEENRMRRLHKSIDGTLEIEDLSLPIYKSYFYFDEVTSKYADEREKILELYANKDFYELTLQYLGIPKEHE